VRKLLVAATALRCIVLPDKQQVTEMYLAVQEKLDLAAICVSDTETLEQIGGLREATTGRQVAFVMCEVFEEDAEIKSTLAGDGLDLGCLHTLNLTTFPWGPS